MSESTAHVIRSDRAPTASRDIGATPARRDERDEGHSQVGPGAPPRPAVDRPHRRLRVRAHRLERQGVVLRLAAGAADLRLRHDGLLGSSSAPSTDPAWTEAVEARPALHGRVHDRHARCSARSLALLLDKGVKGEGFFRAIYLFPMAVSFIAAGVVWRWLMNPAPGRPRRPGLNLALRQARARLPSERVVPQPVLGRDGRSRSRPIWALTGYIMALYLAGFRGVPEELREAARMDGASEWRVYRHVVFPHLTAGHAVRADHPRPHLDQGVRPDRRHRRQAVHHADARRLHVDPDLRRARLREGSSDRDAPARRRLAARDPVHGLHDPLGARA